MTKPLEVIQYGLGSIGCAMARLVVERDGVELVGAVDIDPAKIGRDIGEVIGLDGPLGLSVVDKLIGIETEPQVALHTTGSYFDLFAGQIVELLEAGLDVVSTSEELAFPWLHSPDQALRIDEVGKAAGKTVLATGANPGFLLDSLPLFLTSICQRVDRIEATRFVDATPRRGPFQKKIGAGLSVEEFNQRMAGGRMGHVGLKESMAMLFDTLGRKLVSYETGVEPMVAEVPIETGFVKVETGQVRGLRETATGSDEAGEFARLVFIAALDAGGRGDTIEISGKPDLSVELHGANGDLATVAIVVNAIRRVVEAPPGVVTMRDLPLTSAY